MQSTDKQQLESSQNLPSYLYADCCDERHYLSLNKDIQGKWSIAYADYHGDAIGELAINECTSIRDALERMRQAYVRWRNAENE